MTQAITETIGLDVGDRYSRYQVLGQADGEDAGGGRVPTTPSRLQQLFAAYPQARVVLEVGTHSRWISEIAEASCAEVLVANPRKLRFIYGNDRKSDQVDALALARVGRLDPNLLAPIRHRAESTQRDLATIRARAGLVQARTKLVNTLRGVIKSFGFRFPPMATERIGPQALEHVPGELRSQLGPLLVAIEALSGEIASYDAQIKELAASHPEAALLTQVHGVGALTALAFLLTIEDRDRFRSSRTVGAFFGLVPRRDQSGAVEKQLPISKAGDRMVRTLLVQCAHRILAKNGQDSDLRRAGERIASRGGATAKRRAVIAVARKLAVLMHALWRSGEVYRPLENHVPTA